MDQGAHYYKCDLQVHTPRDWQWTGPNCSTDKERYAYAQKLVAACRDYSIHAIGITDHNDMLMAKYIRRAAAHEKYENGDPVPKSKQLIVFPGMELTLAVPCQAIVLFDADFPDDMFQLAMSALTIAPAPDTDKKAAETARLSHIKTLSELKSELDKHEYLRETYIVFPNVSDGGKDTLLRAGNDSKYSEMPFVGGYTDGSFSNLGSGNKKILRGEASEWGNKKVAVIQTSDNRKNDHRDLGRYPTWIKWAVPTAEALRQACLAQESRISHSEPTLPSTYINSISVSNSSFLGPVDIGINPQYTALIGGRGTGKSTVLEYVRWALADQLIASDSESDIPNYQERRKRLVEQTLGQWEANVQINFTVNGTAHALRRDSQTGQLNLKIGDGDFEECTEADIRSLLPIQAYSQKQLSNVSVRLDELDRFIRSPIRTELDQISQRFAHIKAEIRESFAALQNKRRLQREIESLRLTRRSLYQQAEELRNSLKNVSDKDREILQSKKDYDAANQGVTKRIEQLSQTQSTLREAKSYLDQIQSPVTQEIISAVGQTDAIQKIDREVARLLAEVQGHLGHAVNTLEKGWTNGKPTGLVADAAKEWQEEFDRFLLDYKTAQQKSVENTEKVESLNSIEQRLRETEEKVARAEEKLGSYGDIEARYRELRVAWKELHQERAELLTRECNRLTERANEEIRAFLDQGKNLYEITQGLRRATSGSGLRRERIDAVVEGIQGASDPIDAWDNLLSDFEVLVEYNEDDDFSNISEHVRHLYNYSFRKSDIERIAKKMDADSWLELALCQINDTPVFEFRTKDNEYIPFENASAGQQATALLKGLLNQPGPPLIVDQPEEDLDNPVVLTVVNELWRAKHHRQVIFASHNANLVVNGDADLVVWCDHRISGDQSRGKIEGQGAIDVNHIRSAIKTVMEGGEKAFLLRYNKYGF